ncbi:MAG: hypothetical protein K2X27_08965 [Candidatus Obscuribacterales bacterium]|nr:hypothetical protein [Candidatus Obscuribacterales bacterium]
MSGKTILITGLLVSGLLSAKASLAGEESPAAAEANSDKNAAISTEKNKNLPLTEVLQEIELSIDPEDAVVRGNHGLKIRIKNNTDRAVIFDGQKAIARLNGKEYKCLAAGEFEDLSGSQPDFLADLGKDTAETIGTAVTVGALPTVSDWMKNRKSILGRYGQDEERRQDTQNRFGQRILWPGDESAGIIMFQAKEALKGALLEMPITAFFDSKDRASINSRSKR